MMRVLATLLLALATWVCALSEPVTIRYACTDGAESIGYINQIVAEFERAYPGIHVKVEPIVSGVNYKEKLLAMVAANIAPDMARMGQADYRSFAIRNAILPLGPFLRSSPEVHLKDYYENIVRYFSFEGELWVMPRAISSSGLVFYNKRLLREAKLPDPDGTWTWDFQPRPELGAKDFLTCIQRLTKRLPGGRTAQFGYSTSWPQLWMSTLLNSSGLSMWNDDAHPTRMNATNPDVIRVFMLASDTVK
jgi:multiple sugar transport system substrate-binding protein